MNVSKSRMSAKPGRQRGSIALFAALGISVLVIMLSVLDMGFMYYYKRDYQKAADFAAMAGASRLENGCAEARTVAITYARDNISVGWNEASDQALVSGVQCGIWRRPNFQPTETGDINAIRVVVTGQPPRFLIPGNRQISASAVASSGDPVAAFSVGTRLAGSSGSSTLGNVLGAVGINLTSVNLMSYEGLAGVQITPKGLLEALGLPVSADLSVADFNNLLAVSTLSLGDILDAAVVAAGQEHLLGVNAALVNALRVPLEIPSVQNIPVRLGGNNGVFAPVTSTVESALEVSIDALDLLATTLNVAAAGRGIDLGTALSIPGIGGITLKSGITEPAAIGIGGIGTQAYSAQTRVFAHVNAGTVNLAGDLLGRLLNTSVSINLPIVIDLASATGTLEDLCSPSLKNMNAPPRCVGGEDCADISVSAQIAKICIGSVDQNTLFSNSASCDQGLGNQQLLNVSVLGMTLASLNTKLDLNVAGSGGDVILATGQGETLNGSLNLGTMVNDLTDALLVALLADGIGNAPALNSSRRRDVASEIWAQVDGGSCGSGTNGRNCRRNKVQEARALIESSVGGLSGFLSNALLNPVVGLLGSVLTLNLVGILSSVGGLVGGLLSGIGDLLGGIVGALFGNACTGGGIFGGNGSNSGCVDELANALNQNQSSGGNSLQSGNAFLLGLLMDILRPILDAVGNQLLMPLLRDVLGLQVGQTDVTVMGLQCLDGSVLVQ